MNRNSITLALPNKGRMYEAAKDFLKTCELSVKRENERQYEANMTGISEGNVRVVFQRVADIPRLLREGRAHLGITGVDILMEEGGIDSLRKLIPVFPSNPYSIHGETENEVTSLPFGYCELVVAVPDHWADIRTIRDVAELAGRKKTEGQALKVATGFPILANDFLQTKGITPFKITSLAGATESAPRIGSADFIVDLKSSGQTLSENHLKLLSGGEVLKSSACLVASKKSFMEGDNSNLFMARVFIDRIEAHLNAKHYCFVQANIEARDVDDLRNKLTSELSEEDRKALGQGGPTVAKVIDLFGSSSRQLLHSVSIQIKNEDLERVVRLLRDRGGRDILVTPINFVYDKFPKAFKNLENKLEVKEVSGQVN